MSDAEIVRRKKQGLRPCFIVEEIDKFKPTEFKLNKFFELLNAVYEANGQVIATSNASPETLTASWGVSGDPTALGSSIVSNQLHWP